VPVDRERLAQRLRRRAAAEAIALAAASEIVVLEEDIEVTLDLGWLEVPRHPARHAEALVEERAIHPRDEAIGARRVPARGAVLDAF
jgi:hypothetical protein